MIALLAYFAAKARVVEVIVPRANHISIQALLDIEDLGALDKDAAAVLAEECVSKNLDYSPGRMLFVTSGRPVSATVCSAGIRFSVSVDNGHLKEGLALLRSIVSRPLLDDVERARCQARLQAQWHSSWELGLDGVVHIYPLLKRREDELLASRILRPERLTIGVAGLIAPGEAESAWNQLEAGWAAPREPKDYFDNSKPTPSVVDRVYQIVGPSISVADLSAPSGAATMLAIFALGVGKESSLFRVIREGLGLTYRQEGLLLATSSGFSPRLVFTTSQQVDLEKVTSALTDDVKLWNEAIRIRALGMAKGSWVLDGPFDPVSFGTLQSGDSTDDKAVTAAYWFRLTGRPWEPKEVTKRLESVSLEDLRAAALKILGK